MVSCYILTRIWSKVLLPSFFSFLENWYVLRRPLFFQIPFGSANPLTGKRRGLPTIRLSLHFLIFRPPVNRGSSMNSYLSIRPSVCYIIFSGLPYCRFHRVKFMLCSNLGKWLVLGYEIKIFSKSIH